MQSQDIKNIIKNLPDTPGVYVFKCGKRILYIGKATSLRDRVRSYFNPDIVTTRSPLISKMLSEFDAIDHIKTDSVLEALVLEAHLIKKYQPEANIDEKDDKSFNWVVVTREDFPQVRVVRGRELLLSSLSKKHALPFLIRESFGPFPNSGQLREAMKIIRKMFPYRDEKCIPAPEQKKQPPKACFNRQIGLCPGVCTGEISKEQYEEHIQNIILFFEGKKKELLRNLKKQMKEFAKARQFEKAAHVKQTLFSLSHIQDVSLIKENILNGKGNFRIESYDIAHLSGTNVVGVMTVVEDGEAKKSDYRKFKINPVRELPEKSAVSNGTGDSSARIINDTAALEQVLTRRLGHIEWPLPNLVVVDGGTAQKRVMEKILRDNHQQIPVVSVVKDEYHRPREILGDKKWLQYEREIVLSNAEAHRFAIGFHKQLRGRFT